MKVASRRFQLGEGPSRGLLRDCDRLQVYDKQVPLASRTTNIALVYPCNYSVLHEAAISLLDKLLCYKIIIREQQ